MKTSVERRRSYTYYDADGSILEEKRDGIYWRGNRAGTWDREKGKTGNVEECKIYSPRRIRAGSSRRNRQDDKRNIARRKSSLKKREGRG